MSETIPVTVTILDKEYRVSCQENEKSELIASAQYLDEKMKSLRDSAGVVGADRLAVITALNIAHEMLQAKQANMNPGCTKIQIRLNQNTAKNTI